MPARYNRNKIISNHLSVGSSLSRDQQTCKPTLDPLPTINGIPYIRANNLDQDKLSTNQIVFFV
jgi:hypothetical protein